MSTTDAPSSSQLETSDGVHLAARRWRGRAGTGAAVVVHGFGASSRETRVVALAEELHRQGYEVLAYDSRGHGSSEGLCTLGHDEVRDVAAALHALGGDRRPTVLIGASMGAIAVLRYAARAPADIAGVVSVSCPARWRLPRNIHGVLSAIMAQTRFGHWYARRHLGVRLAPKIPRGPEPVELIRRARTPVMIVHGLDDPFLASRNAEDLYAAASEPRRLDLVSGGRHAFDGTSVARLAEHVAWVLDFDHR
jgi:alpha-beta hydrolase superfamily lysophospholipase